MKSGSVMVERSQPEQEVVSQTWKNGNRYTHAERHAWEQYR